MRKLSTLFLRAIPLLFLVLSFGVKAQENAIIFTIANEVQTDSKHLEFDLLLLDPDAGQPFEEATVQAGILVNPAIYGGGTITATIIPGTSTLNPTQQPSSITYTQATNVIKLASKAPPGCGGGTIISTDPNNRTRVCRVRLNNTADFAPCSLANLTFSFTTTPYPTKISHYQASDCVNTAAPVSASNVFSMAANLPLNCAVVCDPPLAFAVTGGGAYCATDAGLPVGLAGSELGVTYTLSPGGATFAGTGAAFSFPGTFLAGTYTVIGSKICPDLTVLSTAMTGSAVITATPLVVPEFALMGPFCQGSVAPALPGTSFNGVIGTWNPATINTAAAGTSTYTFTPTSGLCATGATLDVTITPSTTVEFTESACDSYFWALSGETYTTSGDKTYVDGCVTNVLHLIITPSSTVEFTASACDSYFWSVSNQTYTTSGDKTFVVGCVTNILHLTITATATATFAAMGPYVQGSVPGTLPATSIEGFTGTWAPATISTATVGFATYVFTPDAGQCALAGSLTIEVTSIPCPAVATWTGAINNDWFNAGNWNPAVPCATTAVTIPMATNYPTLTSTAVCASVLMQDGASFIGSEFLTVGDVTVLRNFPVPGYHYISTPVHPITFDEVFPLNQSQVWAYLYDEVSGNWMNQLYSDPMNVGIGYSVLMNTPQVATFHASFNNNPVALTLSKMNTSGNPNRVGWNLLGNPFPCSLEWDLIIRGAGVDGAVYLWNGSNYISYTSGVGSVVGGIIPPQNGFFVKTAVDGDFIILPFAARVHSNMPFYKESFTNLLSMRADGNTYSDEAFIHFNDNATTGFDSQLDAYKLMGINAAPQLYSMITEDILNINALPMEGNEVVDLGFKCGVNGTYSFNASGIESFDATTPVWLEDLKTGAVQNLRSNASYSFDYTTADNEKRFKLHFKSAYSVPENSLSGINIYSASRTVVINNTTSLAGEVKIYDLAGRELTHTSMNSSNETRIAVNYAVGTYLVKVITEKGVASNKVFIR